MSAVKKLQSIVSPPQQVLHAGSPEKWEEARLALGLEFPGDFVSCVNTYGSGLFGGFLSLISPFESDVEGYLSFIEMRLRSYRESHEEYPEDCPFPAYPEPGGLLPWGFTENGDTVYWLTTGEPDTWTTVVVDSKDTECEHFDLSVSAFLYEWLCRRIQPRIFPDNAPSPDRPLFRTSY